MLPFVALLLLGANEVQKAREPAGLLGASVPEQGQPVVGIIESTHAINGLKLQLSAMGVIGLGRGFDVGATIDHTFVPLAGAMTAAHLTARKVLSDTGRQPNGTRFRTALTLDVSAAWFANSAAEEGQSDPRLWTGLRNYNAELGFAFGSERMFGVFLKASVLVSLDTSPPSLGPLDGPPRAYTVGASGKLEVGTAITTGIFHGFSGVRLAVNSRPEDERVTLITFLGIALG
jgi:hypothetical protein